MPKTLVVIVDPKSPLGQAVAELAKTDPDLKVVFTDGPPSPNWDAIIPKRFVPCEPIDITVEDKE